MKKDTKLNKLKSANGKQNDTKDSVKEIVNAKTKTVTKPELNHAANGAIETDNSIYTIIGKRVFPYDESTIEDYKKKISEMTLADLQKHAVLVAKILPNTLDRGKLQSKLESEYMKKKFAFVDKKVETLSRETTSEIEKLLRGQ